MASSDSVAQLPPRPSPLVQIQFRLAALFDRLSDPHGIHRLERAIIIVGIVGFLSHLGLIWLCTWLPTFGPLIPIVGTNYLSAIYTPFSFILFYELLLLILTLPQSTTLALGRQFEIISLITVRNVFKDLAEFENLSLIDTQSDPFRKVLIDLTVGILLFLMVGVFYHINRRRPAEPVRGAPEPALALFIAQKKIVALLLSALFFVLLGTSVWSWGSAVWLALVENSAMPRTLTTIFYTDIFTVLVFTDVLLLLLSLLLSANYPLVFRNAGFVACTILMRLALAATWPSSLLAAVASVVFGIIVNAIYLYSIRIASPLEPEA